MFKRDCEYKNNTYFDNKIHINLPKRFSELKNVKRTTGFTGHELLYSFANWMRPFYFAMSDIHATLYNKMPYDEVVKFKWGVINALVNFPYNWIKNIFVYLYDYLLYPIMSLFTFVFYRHTTGHLWSLLSGEYVKFWRTPDLKTPWYKAIFNVLTWLFFIPVEAVGHVLEIVFGLMLVAISPATILLSMIINSCSPFVGQEKPDVTEIFEYKSAQELDNELKQMFDTIPNIQSVFSYEDGNYIINKRIVETLDDISKEVSDTMLSNIGDTQEKNPVLAEIKVLCQEQNLNADTFKQVLSTFLSKVELDDTSNYAAKSAADLLHNEDDEMDDGIRANLG